MLSEYDKCYHLFTSLVTKDPSFVAQHWSLQKDFEQNCVTVDFEMIAAELMHHDPIAKKGTFKDGLKVHFDVSSTSATKDFPWEKKFYLTEDFNRLKREHGEKFTGPLVEWRQTPEGQKIFNAQKAAAFAKGGKGSQSSKKQKGEYKDMSKNQIKKVKLMKAKLKGYESDNYCKAVYELSKTMGKSSAETTLVAPHLLPACLLVTVLIQVMRTLKWC